MERTLFLIAVVALMVFFNACNKEDAIKPSADFTTNIENNTLMAGEQFTVYLDNVQGEFLVYFRGHTLQNTYDPNDPTRRGTPFAAERDSLIIPGYIPSADTVYVFTIVASSSGNWGNDYLQDVKSISVNVNVP